MAATYPIQTKKENRYLGIPFFRSYHRETFSHVYSEMFPMYNELKLVKIETANYTLIFKHKYSIQVKKEGDQYSAEDSALSMFVSGNTLEEVKREIDSEFKFMWDHIASEAEENLSEGARKVKTWLLENIVVEKR